VTQGFEPPTQVVGADAGLHANQAGRQVGELASGIDKNTFHLVGLNKRGAIVLRQKLSRWQLEAKHRRSLRAVAWRGRKVCPTPRQSQRFSE
jgi:hypothetical protein